MIFGNYYLEFENGRYFIIDGLTGGLVGQSKGYVSLQFAQRIACNYKFADRRDGNTCKI